MAAKKKEDLVELYEAFSVEELEERLDLCLCFLCKCGSCNASNSVYIG